MGTSTNHPSPDTLSWRITKTLLGREGVEVERQSIELWTSAGSDREEALVTELGDASMSRACRLADSNLEPYEAVEEFEGFLAEENRAGLMYDLAKRALARTRAQNEGSTEFAQELFGETIGYYASRDLPSLLGQQGRIQRASDSVRLKNKFKIIARHAARSLGPTPIEPERWRRYVTEVLRSLRSEGGAG